MNNIFHKLKRNTCLFNINLLTINMYFYTKAFQTKHRCTRKKFNQKKLRISRIFEFRRKFYTYSLIDTRIIFQQIFIIFLSTWIKIYVQFSFQFHSNKITKLIFEPSTKIIIRKHSFVRGESSLKNNQSLIERKRISNTVLYTHKLRKRIFHRIAHRSPQFSPFNRLSRGGEKKKKKIIYHTKGDSHPWKMRRNFPSNISELNRLGCQIHGMGCILVRDQRKWGWVSTNQGLLMVKRRTAVSIRALLRITGTAGAHSSQEA